jgi:serine/threonine-protein kinase
MGVVYLALMRGPGAFSKLLVVKELRRELIDDPDIVAMFMEEARLSACLSHPNVVQTVEAGSDGDRHYIAMEYLDGQSLHRVLCRAQRYGVAMPLELQCAALCSVLEGLAYAHAALDYDGQPLGLVHRDMSPHNVFVGYDGQVKILDFGIAKTTNASVETGAGILKGKVAYMAPEHAAGGSVDARTDVFAVGVMLWEAATGKRFWSDVGNDMQVLTALVRGAPIPSHVSALAQVDAELRAVIAKATSLNPSQRYASAALLLDDLRAAMASRGGENAGAGALGRFVQELFADDRARLQASIEGAINLYRGPSSGKFRVGEVEVTPGEISLPSLHAALALAEATPAKVGPFQGAEPNAPTPRDSKARRSGRLLRELVVGALALLAGLGAPAGWVAIRHIGSHPQAITTMAAEVPAAAVDSSVASPATHRETMRVVVRATPAHARIVIDRELAFDNPCTTSFAKDGATHAVRVEADGYVSRDDSFEASGDAALSIALERKAKARFLTPSHSATSSILAPSQPPPASSVAPPNVPAAPTSGASPKRIDSSNPYLP